MKGESEEDIKAQYTEIRENERGKTLKEVGEYLEHNIRHATMCMLDEKARRKLPNRCQEIDTIVTLCCETGKKNVEDIVKGKKVIGGMSAKGLLSAVTKRKMVKIFIDKDTISIKRFSFE